MNLKRIRQEKAKVSERIAVLQEKLHVLNEKEVEQENTEIVHAVRALKFSPSELSLFLERLKSGDLPKPSEIHPMEDK